MAHGGKRPGAGRKPKGAKRQEPPVQAAENKLRDRLPELVDMALSMAIDDRDAKMVVYCIDRVLGKAVQPVDVYDTARRLAEERGLDPAKVVSIFDGLKTRRAV